LLTRPAALLALLNSLFNLVALLPFKKPTILATLYLGVYSNINAHVPAWHDLQQAELLFVDINHAPFPQNDAAIFHTAFFADILDAKLYGACIPALLRARSKITLHFDGGFILSDSLCVDGL
jgi:hypothetical protein